MNRQKTLLKEEIDEDDSVFQPFSSRGTSTEFLIKWVEPETYTI